MGAAMFSPPASPDRHLGGGSVRVASGVGEDPRREVLWLFSLAAAFAGLYVTTLCPGVFWGDSAELIGAAASLGIPHPPGYPLYTWLGHLFIRLPLEPAYAVNLMSALSAATSLALIGSLARALGASRPSATLASAALGIATSYWEQATIAEVYAPGALFLLLALRIALLGFMRRQRRWLVLAGGLAGAGLGVHLGLATTGLLFAGLVLITRRGASPHTKTVADVVWAASAALLGSLVFLWLPYRARQAPSMNFGDPRDLQNFSWVIHGGAYRDWFALPLGFWPRAARIVRILAYDLTAPGLALGAFGLFWLGRRDLWLALAWSLGILGNVVFFFDYQVHDLPVFFLPAACLLAPPAALGLDVVLGDLAGRIAALTPRRAQLGLAVALGVTGLLRYPAQNLRHEHEPNEYGQALVDRLPQNAVILHFTTPAEWKYACVFQWYFQLVKGARPDVRLWVLPYAQGVSELLESGVPLFAFANVQALDEYKHVPRTDIAPELRQVTGTSSPDELLVPVRPGSSIK